MPTEYSISDIIISELTNDSFYVGTFEGAEDPDICWPHRHDFYSLVWFTSGFGVNVIDFEEFNIQSNRLFLTEPKQVHNWSYSVDTRGYILVFDEHIIQNLSLELSGSAYYDLNPDTAVFFKALIENLIVETKVKDHFNDRIINAGVSLLLLNLKRLFPQSKHRIKSEEFLRLSKLISETVSAGLSVTDYADKLHVTPEKLNEICKENCGDSPKKIIQDKKITESKRLLYFTDLSIKEVAYRLGFEDSSYFSRIFKHKTGLSPSDFKLKST